MKSIFRVLLAIVVFLATFTADISMQTKQNTTLAEGCVTNPLSFIDGFVEKAHAAFYQSLPSKFQERDPFTQGLFLPACGHDTFVSFIPDAITVSLNDPVTFTAAASDVDGIDSAAIVGTPLPCTLNFGSMPRISFSTSCTTSFSAVGVYGPWTLEVCDTDPLGDGECTTDTAGPITVVAGGIPSVTKTCPPGIYIPGQVIQFTLGYSNPGSRAATISDVWGGPATYDSSSVPSGVTIGPAGPNSVTFTLPAGGSATGTILLRLRATGNGSVDNTATIINDIFETGSDSCSMNVGAGIFGGDIYSFGDITNLTVQGPSVISLTGTPSNITTVGSIFIVRGTVPSLVGSWQATMDRNLDRLLNERARNLPSGSLSGFNIDPDNRLGGEVWHRSGDLSISGAIFGSSSSSSGTIIVDGDVTISGNLTSTRPIGIVSRNGNIRISGATDVLQYVNLYAREGEIQFEDGINPLSARGAFVARTFQFPPRTMSLIYDSRVALNPPPGFISFLLPTILENAP